MECESYALKMILKKDCEKLARTNVALIMESMGTFVNGQLAIDLSKKYVAMYLDAFAERYHLSEEEKAEILKEL